MQALFLQVYVDVKRPPFEIGPDNAWQVLDFAIKIICLCTFNQTVFSSFYHFFSNRTTPHPLIIYTFVSVIWKQSLQH